MLGDPKAPVTIDLYGDFRCSACFQFTEGGTRIVPGHGRICDEFEVVEYRDMVTIVRDRVQAMIRKGLTLDQIKSARPTLDFDPRYGAQAGPGTTTTAQFVEAVYSNLRAGK